MLNKTWSILTFTGLATVALSACVDDDFTPDVRPAANLVIEEPLDTVTFTATDGLSTTDLTLTQGIGSGAFHDAGDPANVIYTVTDRGANIDCEDDTTLLGAGYDLCASGKIFPLPDYAPRIFKLQLNNTTLLPEEGEPAGYTVLSEITLKDTSGAPITGLSNALALDATTSNTEAAHDKTGTQLPYDNEGLDTEGLVRLADGSFWLVDEYGPSLVHVAANGQILDRVVPPTVAAQLAGTDPDASTLFGTLASPNYPVNANNALPDILRLRKLNRGIESIAVNATGNTLYFALQSPLANPDNAAYSASRNVRLFTASLNNGYFGQITGEYVYVLDTPDTFGDTTTGAGDVIDNGDGTYSAITKQSDVKVSEMAVTAAGNLIVLERISKTTKLYRVDLTGATNILNTSWDDEATSPSLEQTTDLANASLATTALIKTPVFNSLTDAPDLTAKIEGIAIADGTRTVLINDNDFGIEGAQTELSILGITADLDAAPSTETTP